MASPSASGCHIHWHSGQLSAQVRTETAGAHTHLYRQHSTQLQQLHKGCKANWLYACQSKPLAEMLSFRISIGLAVSSAAVEARSIPFSYKCRFHIIVISPCCSVALSVSRRSAVVVALSLATKRVSRSTAACQHQTCLFAWQQPLIISRTGLLTAGLVGNKKLGRVLLNSIVTSLLTLSGTWVEFVSEAEVPSHFW